MSEKRKELDVTDEPQAVQQALGDLVATLGGALGGIVDRKAPNEEHVVLTAFRVDKSGKKVLEHPTFSKDSEKETLWVDWYEGVKPRAELSDRANEDAPDVKSPRREVPARTGTATA